jgi:hypothetical protein
MSHFATWYSLSVRFQFIFCLRLTDFDLFDLRPIGMLQYIYCPIIKCLSFDVIYEECTKNMYIHLPGMHQVHEWHRHTEYIYTFILVVYQFYVSMRLRFQVIHRPSLIIKDIICCSLMPFFIPIVSENRMLLPRIVRK